MELGGKSPNIIFSDTDLQVAARPAMNGVFFYSGQVCAAGTRIFAQQEIYEEFVAELTKLSNVMHPGNPLDPKTRLGPVVSKEHFDRVNGYLAEGKREGAKVNTGEGVYEGKGYYIKPTVCADVMNGMKIAREEIFGPVAAAISFKDEADAIFQGNDTTYGLAAAVDARHQLCA